MRIKVHGVVEILGAVCLFLMNGTVLAEDTPTPPTTPTTNSEPETPTPTEPSAKRSPWLFLPTFSSNPKLGNAVGGMAAYVTKFDPKSQVSIFGLSAQYTDTESATATLFARTSFSEDQHRISMVLVCGRIKNDYDDFLGTGMPLKSEDH